MLRITQAAGSMNGWTLHLEGSITGDWVTALQEYCELALRDGRELILDISQVGFADAAGLQLLRQLLRRGVELAGRTPFIASLLGGTPP